MAALSATAVMALSAGAAFAAGPTITRIDFSQFEPQAEADWLAMCGFPKAKDRAPAAVPPLIRPRRSDAVHGRTLWSDTVNAANRTYSLPNAPAPSQSGAGEHGSSRYLSLSDLEHTRRSLPR